MKIFGTTGALALALFSISAGAAEYPAPNANDFLWQWGSSGDYDASFGLEKIEATVLAINAADDERNPPETGLMTDALKRVKNAKLYLILASDETSGHHHGQRQVLPARASEIAGSSAAAGDVAQTPVGCPLLALSRREPLHCTRPLSGVK